MEKRRSVGVTIWSVLLIISAITNMSYFLSCDSSTSERFITIAINSLIILCSIGLLMLIELARKSIIILAWFFAFSVFFIGLYVFRISWPLSIAFVFMLSICLGEIYFFTRPNVKEQFR